MVTWSTVAAQHSHRTGWYTVDVYLRVNVSMYSSVLGSAAISLSMISFTPTAASAGCLSAQFIATLREVAPN